MGGKSRCDVLITAAINILEQHRRLLEQADPPIRAVHLELRIRAGDAAVHTVSLSPGLKPILSSPRSADENREEFRSDALVSVETIATVLEAYDAGEIELEQPAKGTPGRRESTDSQLTER
jgi:hypothetical protein